MTRPMRGSCSWLYSPQIHRAPLFERSVPRQCAHGERHTSWGATGRCAAALPPPDTRTDMYPLFSHRLSTSPTSFLTSTRSPLQSCEWCGGNGTVVRGSCRAYPTSRHGRELGRALTRIEKNSATIGPAGGSCTTTAASTLAGAKSTGGGGTSFWAAMALRDAATTGVDDSFTSS